MLTGWVLCRSCVDNHGCFKIVVAAVMCGRHRITAIFPSLWVLKSSKMFPWVEAGNGGDTDVHLELRLQTSFLLKHHSGISHTCSVSWPITLRCSGFEDFLAPHSRIQQLWTITHLWDVIVLLLPVAIKVSVRQWIWTWSWRKRRSWANGIVQEGHTHREIWDHMIRAELLRSALLRAHMWYPPGLRSILASSKRLRDLVTRTRLSVCGAKQR